MFEEKLKKILLFKGHDEHDLRIIFLSFECDISETPGGSFITSETNICFDSKMNRLEFSKKRSLGEIYIYIQYIFYFIWTINSRFQTLFFINDIWDNKRMLFCI